MDGTWNKLLFPDGTVVFDLTGDTVEAADVAAGKTFHLKNGASAVGTMPDLDAIAFGGGTTAPAMGSTDGKNYKDIADAINTRSAESAISLLPLSVTADGVYQAPNGVAYNTVNVSVKSGVLEIYVHTVAGATVTAERDGVSYVGTDSEGTGVFTVHVPEYGTYTVKSKYNGEESTKSVTLTETTVSMSKSIPSEYNLLQYVDNGVGGTYTPFKLGDGLPSTVAVRVSMAILSAGQMLGQAQATSGLFGLIISYTEARGTIVATGVISTGEAPNGASIPYDSDFHEYYVARGEQHIDNVSGSGDTGTTGTASLYLGNYAVGTSLLNYPMHLQIAHASAVDTASGTVLFDDYFVARKSDGVVGVYDVNAKVFTQLGPGFAAGPVVQ